MSKSLRIVFMGTPGFAVASLDELHRSKHEIVAVITAPDRPAGRGRKLRASEVKEYALTESLPILQPERLKNPEFLESLAALKADLFVVVAFRMLPELVWAMPASGTINLHGSLLPQYRGAAPINWAIINGEEKTGVSTFFINAEIDKGEIIDKQEVAIEKNDTAGDLHDRLMTVGAKLMLNTVDRISEGQVITSPQPADASTLKSAPKLNNSNRSIDWTCDAESIRNLVRGLCPYPAAISELHQSDSDSIGAKIYELELAETSALEPGQVESDNRSYIKVGTGSKDLYIRAIQLSGKRKMTSKDLLNGFSIDSKAKFGSKTV